MTKKRTATLAVCAVLLFCVIAAGCSGPTASPTPSTASNSTKTVSSKAISSVQAVTPTLTPTSTPTLTPTSTPTLTPTPFTTTKGSVTIYAEPVGVCSYCEAAIAKYTNEGWDVTVIRYGEAGFIYNATSYPVIVEHPA